jgi:hypothetical protein
VPLRERFSPLLYDSGFTAVPNAVLQSAHRLNPMPTSTELLLIINLMSFRWRPETVLFPSTTKLARRLGISQPAVRKAIRGLIKAGYLTRRKRHMKSSIYDISKFLAAIEENLVTRAAENVIRRAEMRAGKRLRATDADLRDHKSNVATRNRPHPEPASSGQGHRAMARGQAGVRSPVKDTPGRDDDAPF